MNDDILNFDKVQLLTDELIELCREWNLTTREKVTALQSCMKNYENSYSEVSQR